MNGFKPSRLDPLRTQQRDGDRVKSANHFPVHPDKQTF
jgi:hypothetical protein